MKKAALMIAALALLIANPAPALEQSSKVAKKTIVLPPETVNLKSGTGLDRVLANCLVCHSADYVTMQPPFTKAQWTATVKKMINVMGAKISEDDAAIISAYLGGNYGPGK